MKTAIERACEQAGGQSALAREIGLRPQSVQGWCTNGVCPPGRAVQVEAALRAIRARAGGHGALVTRYELRPDLYPVEDSAA